MNYKVSKYYLFTCLLTLLMTALTVSCSGDNANPTDVQPPLNENADVMTEFYITVGDAVQAGSRSVGRSTPTDGTYDPGSGFENYINLANDAFQVLFFSGENSGSASKFIAKLDIMDVAQVGETASSKTYKVVGCIKQKNLSNKTFRVMILANWGEYPEFEANVTTIDEVCAAMNSVFSFNQEASEIDAEHPIPMYGIKRFAKVTFNESDYCHLGTINLLRAYAKVDIEVDSERWSISSVRLTKAAASGFKAPAKVYDESDYVKNSYESDYTSSPNIPSDDCVDDLMFTRATADSSVFRIYIPEFRNVDGNGNALAGKARMAINFIDRLTGLPSYLGEQFIDFKYYQAPTGKPSLAGKPFNIMRNYWYKFKVEKSDELSDLIVTVDVQPYASVELDPGFGLERDPIDGYIILKKIKQDGADVPTLLYDDLFGNYYDFQKYQLVSNYSTTGIARIKDDEKKKLGLTGDVWLIKRANHHTDDIGDANTKGSLYYNADTGVYHDFRGDPLNLRYINTDPHAEASDTLMIIVDVERDFQFNNIVISSGDNSVESSYYDFAHGNYKGAFNPEVTTECDEDLGTTEDKPENDKLTNFYRAKTNRLKGGWMEIVPYWLIENPRICRLYYNIFTNRYYDKDGYCLQDPAYEEFEFNVGSDEPYVVLEFTADEEPELVYERSTGNYLQRNATSGLLEIVPRPSNLVRDKRLMYPYQPYD